MYFKINELVEFDLHTGEVLEGVIFTYDDDKSYVIIDDNDCIFFGIEEKDIRRILKNN